MKPHIIAPARRPLRGLRVALLVSWVGWVGCSDPAGPGGDGAPVETITELPRALSLAESEVIRRSNAFGLELMGQVVAADSRPNVILSPLSASMALGMTLNGAAGSTFDAMRSALAFEGLEQVDINAAYRDLLDLLVSLDPSVDVSIANAIWANEDVSFEAQFFESVGASFHARAESSDFADPATLEAVNGWAADNTNGKIEKILDSLDPDMIMLLLNAVWFDGAWTTAFDPTDTRPAPFQRPDGSSVEVDQMRLDDVELALGHGPDWSAAELPYGGGAWTMVVLVPWGERSARQVLSELNADEWEQILARLAPSELDLLALPKFTLSYDVFLNDALKRMGMGEAFAPGADFTRLTPIGNQVCIDFVRQKTFVEVDEVGTRAAAVTAVGIAPTSFNGLIVDRPFVFALREQLSGTILFMGLVEDPAAAEEDPVPAVSDCR